MFNFICCYHTVDKDYRVLIHSLSTKENEDKFNSIPNNPFNKTQYLFSRKLSFEFFIKDKRIYDEENEINVWYIINKLNSYKQYYLENNFRPHCIEKINV